MRRMIVLLLALLVAGAVTEVDAQTWVEQLGKKAGEAAKRRVEWKVQQKAEKAVDDVMDGKLGTGNKGKKSQKSKSGEIEFEDAGGQEMRMEAEEQQMRMEPEQAAPAEAPQKQDVKSAEMTYAKSDFVRGDEVIFDDQLTGEQVGEFPSQWDALEGSVEIGKINGENAIMAQQAGDRIAPLFEDMKSYLPEKFTLEFDFWVENPDFEGYNTYILEFKDKERNDWTQNVTLNGVGNDYGGVNWGYVPSSGEDSRGGHLDNVKYEFNSWNHLAISFNKRAMKIYINGVRVANIPNTMQPDRFYIEMSGDGIGRIANASVRNIVLAKGAVPLYDRMMTDGKFITYGITFDVGKSVIKPESMGEITRIVTLMTENPTLKFSIEGHTDSTGNAESNQKLSEARSQAIADKLVELGIAKDRLSAVGKGQNSPIADNSTDEGRAKNRRVEFVKL